jgi:hypothetical protein
LPDERATFTDYLDAYQASLDFEQDVTVGPEAIQFQTQSSGLVRLVAEREGPRDYSVTYYNIFTEGQGYNGVSGVLNLFELNSGRR